MPSTGPASSTLPVRRAPETDLPGGGRMPGFSNRSDAHDVAERVAAFLGAAQGRRRALVLTHDNPDPDALAAAWGLAFLLSEKLGIEGKVAFGGIVGRAENRALVRELKLPLQPLTRLVPEDFDFRVLVDTQPECTNHSLDETLADAVVDHHPARELPESVVFADVGGDYGATASIVTSYLRVAGVTPDRALATALFYGIKSDTRDLGREFEPIDVENYHWLFPLVDHVALSRVEHPSLSPAYFAAMHGALARATVHGEAVVADLDRIYTPDIVAEAADRLLSLDGMRWSLVVGEFEGNLQFSVRTGDRRMNAGKLVRELLVPLGGSAGGHGSMAGGRIALPEGTRQKKTAFRRKLVLAFLKEFGAPARGRKLVIMGREEK